MVTQANIPLPNLISTTTTAKKPEARYAQQKIDEKNDLHSTRKRQLKDKFGQDNWTYKKYKNSHPYLSGPPLLTAISNSIMHSGSDIQKAHFVTIWSALCNATSDHLQCTDWEIIPTT
ncbi:hypothetical protein [Pseudoalteromonas sp. MMG012]|uniref:hypothetical protein n=1 Tax=Pseudoalteromonas sp. MMG012 TaxID=2822686 RepID=UPI001B39E211|nr:hypothetical protein [Pseudoalteromonas sp. MMG012]MBQ4850823.1 hypothetical protein [Pseudoalteromonas sp. MMG012]